MGLSYNFVKTFLVFAESDNIYEAAEKIGLTQPGVSNHLKALESYFGRPLFRTEGRKKVLNIFGLDLYKSLSPKFNSIDQSVEYIQKKYMSPSELTLRIAGRQGALNEISSLVTFPGKVHYYSMDGENVERSLIQNKVEFGISRTRPNSLDIIAKKLVSLKTIFLASKSIFKDKAPNINFFEDLSFLKKQKFYSYSEDIPYMTDWCKYLKTSVERINAKGFINDWETVTKLVKINKGYTICPEYYEGDSELVKISIPEKIVRPLSLYLLYSLETKELFPLSECFNFDY